MSENLTLNEKVNSMLDEILLEQIINENIGKHFLDELLKKIDLNAIIIFSDKNKTKVITLGDNLKQTLINALNENEPLNDLFAKAVLHFAKDVPELSIDQPSLFDNRIKNIFHDIPIDFKP